MFASLPSACIVSATRRRVEPAVVRVGQFANNGSRNSELMKIIVGHSNMDLDCIAAIALARKLHPDHVPIKSGTIHPVARHLYNLYETDLDFTPAKELKGTEVTDIVIVDTCSKSRIVEYLRYLGSDEPPNGCRITIYDHHPSESNDFPAATFVGGAYGAATTILGLEIMRRDLRLTHAEATIALAGIYSDTGNFTHENVTADEFAVASFFLAQGATVRVVVSFLKSLREDEQIELFHLALATMTTHTVKGHDVAFFTLRLPKQVPGLAAVVERVFEVEGPDALFGVFSFEHDDSTLIIARSRKTRIQVNTILSGYGGGGHTKAGSALVRDTNGDGGGGLMPGLLAAVEAGILPALTAADIMTERVETMREDWTLLEASVFLEKIDHTGTPVTDENEAVTGFLTLRDIMKGRKQQMMHAPVKGFMSRRAVSCLPTDTMRELERLFFTHNIGHLPVVSANRLLGIVTRSDYLRTVENGLVTAAG